MESINVTFDENSVLTNNDEDLESLKLETETEKSTEKILEQEASVNQEEVNNDQQDIQEQQAAATMYSASSVDNEIEVCFLLNHDRRQPPR